MPPNFGATPAQIPAPRDQLIARMALRDEINDPGDAKKWDARIAELLLTLIRTEDDWVDLLPAVQRAKAEIERQRKPRAKSLTE